MRVVAEDSDYAMNAVLEYSICSDITPIVAEGLDLDNNTPFVMEPMTGEIFLNFDPQKNKKGYFGFNVCARDIGDNHDIAQVYIYLLREDQRVKFIMRSHPEEIRARLLEFRSVLANATDSIVNVDHFRVHENYDGTIDKTKTDVLLHFVNPLDNTIMEVDDVLQTLDYKIVNGNGDDFVADWYLCFPCDYSDSCDLCLYFSTCKIHEETEGRHHNCL
jgi:hypothetical protein